MANVTSVFCRGLDGKLMSMNVEGFDDISEAKLAVREHYTACGIGYNEPVLAIYKGDQK